MLKAVVLLAPGFEEIEAITVIDVLRRANISVRIAAVASDGDLLVAGSHNISVKADCLVNELSCAALDLLVFPGGLPGSQHLADSEEVQQLAKEVAKKGGKVAAICAAPIALNAAELLSDTKYTCYPSFEEQIEAGEYTAARVQVSGNTITACGPGASMEFAFTILEELGLKELAENLKKEMQVG